MAATTAPRFREKVEGWDLAFSVFLHVTEGCVCVCLGGGWGVQGKPPRGSGSKKTHLKDTNFLDRDASFSPTVWGAAVFFFEIAPRLATTLLLRPLKL